MFFCDGTDAAQSTDRVFQIPFLSVATVLGDTSVISNEQISGNFILLHDLVTICCATEDFINGRVIC